MDLSKKSLLPPPPGVAQANPATPQKTLHLHPGLRGNAGPNYSHHNAVAYRPVAKRWLCKQRPLLGNARSNRRMVFFCGPSCASTILEGLCFLRGPCQGDILMTTGAAQLVDKKSVRGTVKKIVARLRLWKEDFMCAVVNNVTVIVPMLTSVARKRQCGL
jgi:hypothetical protein